MKIISTAKACKIENIPAVTIEYVDVPSEILYDLQEPMFIDFIDEDERENWHVYLIKYLRESVNDTDMNPITINFINEVTSINPKAVLFIIKDWR